MRRIKLQLGLVAAMIAFAPPAMAIELITFEHPFRAHHLAGVVVDTTGAPVSGVVVEDRDPTFTHVLATTKTDANGYFVFPKAKKGTTHYLHLNNYGFDPMQITVQLGWFAKCNLRIRLHIAT